MTVIIAVDESGDLGFRFEKKGTTRFLVFLRFHEGIRVCGKAYAENFKEARIP